MGLFGFLKGPRREQNREIDSPDAVEVAMGAAQVAGVLMKQQWETAGRLRPSSGLDGRDFVAPMFAFSLGVLVSALQGKGIEWGETSAVSQQTLGNAAVLFAETYMPDYKDHKEMAKLILHYGAEPDFRRYVEAGEAAFDRCFGDTEIEEPRRTDDFARAMGYPWRRRV